MKRAMLWESLIRMLKIEWRFRQSDKGLLIFTRLEIKRVQLIGHMPCMQPSQLQSVVLLQE